MATMPRGEYPRPDFERKLWHCLNGTWDFALFAQGEEEKETAFAGDRAAYTDAITVPFSWTSPLSGVSKDVAGVGWYRRMATFDAKGGRVFLCFGAVDYLADVYVNGTHVLHHQGGYTTFDVDVSGVWHAVENIIEVRAEDYRHDCQTFGKQGYGQIQGIWQPVWLEARPQSYIRHFRFDTRCNGDITLTADVLAADGTVLTASFDGQSSNGAVQNNQVSMHFTLQNPQLWTPDTPYLYEGTLTLQDDVVYTYFGVREFGYRHFDGRPYPWLTLNGKPIYLNGTLDQAFNPDGHFTYPTDQAMRDEAWRLKRLGLNMVRIHIKPEEPRKLYWMDKLGVLVMADVPNFWGQPNETARAAYEHEWPDILKRDCNHPSIFAWVMFNESWGLFTKDEGYTKATREWVRSVYQRAKLLEPSRLIEDNSACHYDHVESDLCTWHFYFHGYQTVRDHIRDVVQNSYPGSAYHYRGSEGAVQTDIPLMNSECGMVWGVDGSAGDSDIAWNYHYMLNEYRLHEKVCGFIFTEFHDVINEFNGYYRLDNTDKDFGYQDFCQHMSIKDLHAEDFVATDCAPCQIADAGAAVSVPLTLSSFGDAHHKEGLTLRYELWHDGLQGRITDATGCIAIAPFGYGATVLDPLTLTLPNENAVAVLSLYLCASSGAVISRNFTTFDVRGAWGQGIVELPVTSGVHSGFVPVWQAMDGEKLCMGGSGEVSYGIRLNKQDIENITVYVEAGSKRVFKKDLPEGADSPDNPDYMRGYRVDRGGFKNSYWMTDETRYPSTIEVLIDGECIDTVRLTNDAADARGVLSWLQQGEKRTLDEAGSYGERLRIALPSRLIPALEAKGGFTLSFRAIDNGGLALYGRGSGRYAHGLLVEAE